MRTAVGGRDWPRCLISPEKAKCRSLAYIMDMVLRKDMLWINKIFLTDRGIYQEIILPDRFPTTKRSITITCPSSPCNFTGSFGFAAKSLNQDLVIQMEHMILRRSYVKLHKVHLKCVAMSFVNSWIIDGSSLDDEPGEIVLSLEKTRFEKRKHLYFQGSGVWFDNASIVSVSFSMCSIINADTHIEATHVTFHSRDTVYSNSQVRLSATTSCLFTANKVVFNGWTPGREFQGRGDDGSSVDQRTSGKSPLEISAQQIELNMVDSSVQNNVGGLTVEHSTENDSFWMRIYMNNCTFENNRKSGLGGAVEVTFFPPEIRRLGNNFVKIYDSKFVENMAQRKGVANSMGGALSIKAQFSLVETLCHVLVVDLQNNSFIDNEAQNGGGAIFMVGKCLDARISGCSFDFTRHVYKIAQGVFIWSESDISVERSVFKTAVRGASRSLVQLSMKTPTAQIWHLHMVVQCPAWFNLKLETHFVPPRAKRFAVSCASCPASSYTPSDGYFLISNFSSQHNLSVQDSNMRPTDLTCISCPPGAFCPGHDLISKPNFWGYFADNGVKFLQCPKEYCCNKKCSGYNQCAGHRAGPLCGSCQEGYSLSMLSLHCVENRECHDSWLWALVLLAMVMYMLWYTFKYDLFNIPGKIFTKIFKLPTSDQENEVHYMDKGYFGIVTYFVQVKALMSLSISEESGESQDTVLTQIQHYVELALNLELTYFSGNMCALKDFTTTDKMAYKLMFLCGIFGSWVVFFGVVNLLTWVPEKHSQLRMKLVYGLVEIMKYTYLGFSSIVFYSVTCSSIAESPVMFGESSERKVWFYDGSVLCYSNWQKAMVMFGLLYSAPYPVFLYLGMKLLKEKTISKKSFCVGVGFPLPVLLYWAVLAFKSSREAKDSKNDTESRDPCFSEKESKNTSENAIYCGFKGGFRESKEGTQYWECVLMLRRLLISATILVPNSMMQLSLCAALCTMFLLHHAHVKPFEHAITNVAEALSLTLLIGVVCINLLKSSFIYQGVSPQGFQLTIMSMLQMVEVVFVIVLIAFIICVEAMAQIRKRIAQRRWRHPAVLFVARLRSKARSAEKRVAQQPAAGSAQGSPEQERIKRPTCNGEALTPLKDHVVPNTCSEG